MIALDDVTRLGAYDQSVEVTGRAAGTATLTFGKFRQSGVPAERSDSIVFTFVPAVPLLDLVPDASGGWVSTPDVDLSTFSSVRLSMTFLVDDEVPFTEFFGDGLDGDQDPADELQLAVLGEGDGPLPPVVATFDAFPEGPVEGGAELVWDVTVDLRSLPPGTGRLFVRPQTDGLGTSVAQYLTLSSAELTVVR